MSNEKRPLHILFATNFSDKCYRAIPAVAQLADQLAVRLTLLHVYDANRTSRPGALEALQSFFPEADRYGYCQRVAVSGKVAKEVGWLCQVRNVNLVVAPAGDDLGFPRVADPSVRRAFLEECNVPVWSIHRTTDVRTLGEPVRQVACWVPYGATNLHSVHMAAEYAQKTGAGLHLLHVLPELHEATVAEAIDFTHPLSPRLAEQGLRKQLAELEVDYEVHVAAGSIRRMLPQMVKASGARLMFAPYEGTKLSDWFRLRFADVDAVPCPVIYAPRDAANCAWSLQPGRASEFRQHQHQPVRARTMAAPA